MLDDNLKEESSSHSRVEWCQDLVKENVQESESKESLQRVWSLAVENAVQVASLVDAELTPEALAAVSGQVDIRPHFYDKKLKMNLLVDSGSAVTA